MAQGSVLQVTLLGTGNPRPNPQRTGPSQVVRAGDARYLVDCGPNATLQLQRAGLDPAAVRRLLFTHLHTDHTLDYGQFVLGGWAIGRDALRVWGPPGTARLTRLLFEEVYAEDIAYRLSLGRPPAGLLGFPVAEVGEGVVLEEGELRVRAVRVEHAADTRAYRFEWRGQSLVISGDTTYCPALVELARGADLLVQDCQLASDRAYRDPTSRRLWEHLRTQHATPEEAGRMAREAGVRTLVLSHLPPAVDVADVAARAAREFAGRVVVGEDLLTVAV
jgi:ribonuclease BN (tRNA processing enzyme)